MWTEYDEPLTGQAIEIWLGRLQSNDKLQTMVKNRFILAKMPRQFMEWMVRNKFFKFFNIKQLREVKHILQQSKK